jgi:hypothetical protein
VAHGLAARFTPPVLLEPPAGDTPAVDAEGVDGLDPEALPPEAHLPAPPLEVAQRKPGEGRFGRWIVWALVAFSLLTILQSMRSWR